MDKLITILISASFYLTLAAILMAFVRFLKGPSVADRTVALDALTIVSISLIVLLAYFFKRVIYLDVALLYGLLSFLGVLAITRYIEGGL